MGGERGCVFDGPPDIRRLGTGAGAPCRERWNAFIFACMSCGSPPALALERDGAGIGRRAALTLLSGADELAMEGTEGRSDDERRVGTREGGSEEVLSTVGCNGRELRGGNLFGAGGEAGVAPAPDVSGCELMAKLFCRAHGRRRSDLETAVLRGSTGWI